MGGMGGFLDNTKKGDPQKKPWKFQYYNDLEDDLGSHP
jgi:predicted enzyme related to lactoylglutathione lyase